MNDIMNINTLTNADGRTVVVEVYTSLLRDLNARPYRAHETSDHSETRHLAFAELSELRAWCEENGYL